MNSSDWAIIAIYYFLIVLVIVEFFHGADTEEE